MNKSLATFKKRPLNSYCFFGGWQMATVVLRGSALMTGHGLEKEWGLKMENGRISQIAVDWQIHLSCLCLQWKLISRVVNNSFMGG